MRLAADPLQCGGQLVVNGFSLPPESQIDWDWLHTKKLALYYPNSCTWDRLQEALVLVAEGVIRVEEVMTGEFAVAEAPQAYEMLLDEGADSLACRYGGNPGGAGRFGNKRMRRKRT